ncbi:MAG: hypothetical protein LAT65_21200 [Saccharospirillum sp.]|nr:hypothetical protein [Saccharospirillum sp.]
MIYANEDRGSVLFWDELVELSRQINLDVVHVLQAPPEDWSGEVGLVDDALLARYLDSASSDTDYFVCGPPPLMNVVEQGLRERRVPLQHIHSERFKLV